MPVPDPARTLITCLQKAGFEAYAVGGCVRDTLRGTEPHDWDLCTSARPDQVHEVLSGYRLIDTGLKHGTVTVVHGGMSMEVTTFRTEGGYSDHRRPDSVTFVSHLEEDLARRDFTVNAMAWDGEHPPVDPFGGRADLERGVIRCVGDPARRFEEDALRILRALRFAAALDFSIDPATAEAARKQKALLRYVSPERIYSELTKLLVSKGAPRILRDYPDLLAAVLPEISPCVGFDQRNPCHNEDVWTHTVSALALSAPDPIIRWALLFHDVGKPDTFTVDDQGIGHFRGHPVLSAKLAKERLIQLKADRHTRDTVEFLVYYHDAMPPVKQASFLRWMRKFGPERLRLLYEVRRCDGIAHTDVPVMQRVREVTRTFGEMLEDPSLTALPCTPAQLNISGHDLSAAGIPKGKAMGQMLECLLDDVISGRCPNEHEALIKQLEHHREVLP